MKLCKHLEPIKEHLIIIHTNEYQLDSWYCKTCGVKKVYDPEESEIDVREEL